MGKYDSFSSILYTRNIDYLIVTFFINFCSGRWVTFYWLKIVTLNSVIELGFSFTCNFLTGSIYMLTEMFRHKHLCHPNLFVVV